jgi:ubiquinone/menaquinone biosynthesis C-methylase UbiE
MTRDAVKFTGTIPEYYDKGLGPNIFTYYADDIARRVATTGATQILEIAAGTGIVTRMLRDAIAPDAHLTATDLNQAMLDIAAGKFNNGEAVNFQTADAMDLPFDDNMFDALVCQFGVMFFPDKLRCYQEALRVLRPDGCYIFNVWSPWSENPFAQIAHETIAGFFTQNPPTFYDVPFSYHDIRGITGTLHEAGFKEVSAEQLPHIAELDDIPHFAEALVYGNPIVAEIDERGGNPDEIVSAVEAAIVSNFGEAKSMPLEAILFTAGG